MKALVEELKSGFNWSVGHLWDSLARATPRKNHVLVLDKAVENVDHRQMSISNLMKYDIPIQWLSIASAKVDNCHFSGF